MQEIKRISHKLGEENFITGASLLSDFARSLQDHGLIPDSLTEELKEESNSLVCEPEPFVSIDSAASLLGVGRATVYNRMRDAGIVPVKKAGDRKSYLKMSDVDTIGKPRKRTSRLKNESRRKFMMH